MRPHASVLRITPEGLVDRSGIVTPPGTMVVAEADDIIVVKVPGHHYYTSQGGPWGYAGAEYEVYRIIEGGPEALRVAGVLSFPVRQTGPYTGGS